jgi:hypothetical protein
MFRRMVGVPKFGSDEQIFSLDNFLFDSFFNAFSNLHLVSIHSCTVNVAIAHFDSVVNHLLAFIFVELPSSKTNQWNIVAIV